jgi:1-acyl-sn-glycerol-3-phosphate acyltransferase
MRNLPRWVSLPVDLLVTLTLWVYFIGGFATVFLPLYLVAMVVPWRRAQHTQWLNFIFFSGFFGLLRILTPALRLRISPEVRRLRSAVVICNHQSYLDPILLASIFRRQATIVKPIFFRVPVFGWILDASGYMAPAADRSGRMVRRVERVTELLANGGVLFVFPEGTRSRDGSVNPFKTGAFKLARLLDAPIEYVLIQNTGKVFVPGRFLFRTCVPRTMELVRLGGVDAQDVRDSRPGDLAARARAAFVETLSSSSAGTDPGPGDP